MSFFQADSLSINFGGIKAVDGVTFDVDKGVEDIAATNSAPSATNSGERAGSVSAKNRIETISSSCENSSQPRRRPNCRVKNGTCSASTSGAQMNFSV